MRALASVCLIGMAMPVAAAAPAVRVHGDTREVRACLPLPDGALVGTGGGLVRVGADGATRAVWTAADGLPGTRVDAVVAIDDDVWVATDAGAARVRVTGDAITIEQALASRPVRDVARSNGDVYLATWDGGVLRVAARGLLPVPFATAAAGKDRVAALAVAGGTLWAGTAAGLFRLARGQMEPVALGDAAIGAIASLYGDGERLWIAGAGGLFVRDGNTMRAIGGGELRRVTSVDGAIVVAGMGDGLARVDRGRLVALPGAPRGLAMAQAVAANGSAACAGGLEGLWLRARAGGAWVAAAPRAGLPSNDVSALAVDGDRLWVGMFDRGLAVRERGAWRTIDHPDLDARVNAILIDRSRVWVGTAAGLMSLESDDVARLTRRDGLPGRGVLALARLRDGRIVAGTTSGAALVEDGRPQPVGPAQIGNVWAIGQDASGMLWLGTTTGVYRGPAVARPAKDAPADGTWQRMSIATGHLRDDWVMAIAAHDHVVWVGTYKGGVTRFDLDESGAITARQLGDGWINPGGLRFDGDHLHAATMDGLLVGDGTAPTWTLVAGLPGKDVTASARIGATTWIATRRGLAERR
jgi:ligand-binding sensor domain-containing protein